MTDEIERVRQRTYRDESDDVRVTVSVRLEHSDIPLDIEGLKARIQEKVDAEVQKLVLEYLGVRP